MDQRDIWETFFGNQRNNQYQETNKSEHMSKREKRYKWNCVIFEIATNWDNIRNLLSLHKNGKIDHIYKIDKQWLDFLKRNKIDLLSYNEDDKDKFINDYFFETLQDEENN